MTSIAQHSNRLGNARQSLFTMQNYDLSAKPYIPHLRKKLPHLRNRQIQIRKTVFLPLLIAMQSIDFEMVLLIT